MAQGWGCIALGIALGLELASCKGCGEPSAPNATPPARSIGVAEKAPDDSDLVAFCDRYFAPKQAPRLSKPPLIAGQGKAAEATGRWRWINVWATWCKPCLEEIPLLLRWQTELADRGGRKTSEKTKGAPAYDLQLLSADTDPQALHDFMGKRADYPSSGRLQSPEALASWLQSMEFAEAPSLPVQLIVNPQGQLRCLRNGPIAKHHKALLSHLLQAAR